MDDARRGMHQVALGDSPNTGDVWRRYLKTLEVDAWETYEKIPEDQRDVMERVYGCRKVCASLASGACRECGADPSKWECAAAGSSAGASLLVTGGAAPATPANKKAFGAGPAAAIVVAGLGMLVVGGHMMWERREPQGGAGEV